MAFVKKTWKDRIAEFPTRRRLTKSNGDSELVTVSREEGTLSQEGDAFSAENMNDLERRVDDAISEINSNLKNSASKLTKLGETTGTNVLTLPTNFNELVVIVVLPNKGKCSIIAPYEVLETDYKPFMTGKPYDPSNAGGTCVTVDINKTNIRLNQVRTSPFNSNNYSLVTNESKLIVFYR